jgi:hypothetical protein
MPLIVSKNPPAPPIDPGGYVLELRRVEKVWVNDPNNLGQKVERIQLTFVIRDHLRWGGAEFTDLCTEFFGPRSKLGQILTALNNGVRIPSGEFDLESFVGRRMCATVHRTESGYIRVVPETALPLDGTDRDDT